MTRNASFSRTLLKKLLRRIQCDDRRHLALEACCGRVGVPPEMIQALSFRAAVLFPECKHVLFGVLADNKVAHLRHRGFAEADFATEFFYLRRRCIDGGNSDIVSDRLLEMLAR